MSCGTRTNNMICLALVHQVMLSPPAVKHSYHTAHPITNMLEKMMKTRLSMYAHNMMLLQNSTILFHVHVIILYYFYDYDFMCYFSQPSNFMTEEVPKVVICQNPPLAVVIIHWTLVITKESGATARTTL